MNILAIDEAIDIDLKFVEKYTFHGRNRRKERKAIFNDKFTFNLSGSASVCA